MSLYKQLWMAIILLMAMAFIGSFYVSLNSTKSYVEEQIYRKNFDTASTLALSLSNSDMDEISTELFISSQFDTGHYQYIRVNFVDGVVIERNHKENHDKNSEPNVPKWLMTLLPIDVEPGIAQITDGWNQKGTLSIKSDIGYAYDELWNISKKLFLYFVLVSIFSVILGSIVLKIIIRPLDNAVTQAKAIGERRFVTTVEPKTREFRQLIRSMNQLSAHVKTMLDNESRKLENWRRDIQIDSVTGLLIREPILNKFHAFLQSDNENSQGSVLIIRIFDLIHLNHKEGRETVDAMLRRFGQLIKSTCKHSVNAVSGRLTGSDLIILKPREVSPLILARELYSACERICRELGVNQIHIMIACSIYQVGDTAEHQISRLEHVLDVDIDSIKENCLFLPTSLNKEDQPVQWEPILKHALAEKRFVLETFPVMNSSNEILHFEAPVRLVKEDQSLVTAGHFMPHISRLGLGAKLDLIVTELALSQINENKRPIGINLSADLLMDVASMVKMQDLLKQHQRAAKLLWVELPEYGVFQHLDAFRLLCHFIKPWVKAIGIEHVAKEVVRIGELHDLGLAYIKMDYSMIRDINTITASQVFLRGFCTIIHSIGLKAIAEGVKTEQEWQSLCNLGFDGGTGVYFPKE